MDNNGKCVGTEDIDKINKLDLMERNKAVYLPNGHYAFCSST